MTAKVIEVRRMGTMEVRHGRGVRHVDAYSVFVDGRETQPWVPKGQANRDAKEARRVTEQVCVPSKYAPEWTFTVKVGDRVELSPSTDQWISGDRCGEVRKLDGEYVYVRMDVSRKTLKCPPDHIGKKL